MDETPEGGPDPDLPPHLRQLRLLVTVLTVVMIAGVITITGLLVIRLSDSGPAPVLVSPDRFALPADVGLVSYSILGAQTVLIGDDRVVRVFDTDTGALVREIPLD